MSGREVESALHLGLVFQQIPETSTVPTTSGETSRKRTADVESAADVPSASRRRRNANTDASSYIRPTFPSCCVNGITGTLFFILSKVVLVAGWISMYYICVNCGLVLQDLRVVEPTCLLPSSFDPTSVPTVQPPMTPIFGTQVVPQVHSPLSTIPSTSIVHNVTPIALHLHGPPSIASNYAYFLPHPLGLYMQGHHVIQPLMGLRLPTTPVQYVSQDIPFTDHTYLPPLITEITDDYTGLQRSLDELPVGWFSSKLVTLFMAEVVMSEERVTQNPPPPAIPTALSGASTWDPSSAHYRLYPSFSYLPGAINAQMETVVSRVRIAQAAAQVGVDPATATQMLTNQTQGPPAVDFYGDRNQNSVPLVEGPVAVPTMATEWAPPPPPALPAISDTVAPANYHQQLERLANGEIPFRAWEAAVLHIFDRMAPQMNAARLPPKGMTKNEIDQLKSFRITDPALLMEKVCVICQCDFEKRELVRMLPCAHHFHLKCIDKWLKGNRTCPICRQNAAPEGTDGGSEVVSTMATATATAVVTGTSGGAGAENGGMDGNGGLGNASAAVQVITQTGATPESANLAFPDSHF
uniref:RING-type domain-containing protein n=1 Tax=Setaria digitata TaxID=48799 RepID=A0A915PXR1_9BILA